MPAASATEAVRPVRELAGALGDLGTFLPLTLGVLLVTNLAAAGVLAGFGLAYLVTAVAYRAPVPVQPMKVAAAVLVTAAPAPPVVAGAGLVLAATFLVAWVTGVLEPITRHIPRLVTAALQAGLGVSLAWLALGLIARSPAVGVVMALALVLMLARRPAWPAALIVLAAGAALGPSLGLVPTGPLPPPAPTWPSTVVPEFGALAMGALDIALPQIPLTVTNAIVVTAAVGRAYFPRARGLTPSRLTLTTGLTNLVAAPIGGIPMCHGAGGLAAHYRFGARTGWAPMLMGLLLVTVGVVGGPSAAVWLGRIPECALGALLLVPALDLLRAARPLSFRPREAALLAVGAAVAVYSPGLAFLGLMAYLIAGARLRGDRAGIG